MSRRDDETEEWLKRALTKALGHVPDDHTVLSALVHAGCPPTLRYRRGMQRLVGRSLCSECRQQQPALTCFDNDPDGGSCGWQVCDQCLRKALPDESLERIAACAVRTKTLFRYDGMRLVWTVAPPGRHCDLMPVGDPEAEERMEQGFVTTTGRYVDREEAWCIAEAAEQIVRRVSGDGDRLFSENLW